MRAMKQISTVLIIAGLALIFTFGASAFAATSSNQNITFANSAVLSLGFTGSSTLSFTSPTAGLDSIISTAVTLSGKSNQLWTITASGTDFTSGANVIPVGRLSVRTGTNAFKALTNAGVAIVASQPKGAQDVPLDYNLHLEYTDPIATGYQSTLTYTISN